MGCGISALSFTDTKILDSSKISDWTISADRVLFKEWTSSKACKQVIRQKYQYLIGAQIRYDSLQEGHALGVLDIPTQIVIESITFSDRRIRIDCVSHVFNQEFSARDLFVPFEVHCSYVTQSRQKDLMPVIQQSLTEYLPIVLLLLIESFLPPLVFYPLFQWESLDKWFESETYFIFLDNVVKLLPYKFPRLSYLLDSRP